MPTDFSALISRLEAASGPDREIDAALHVALCEPEQYPDDLRYYRLPASNMDHMDMCAPGTYWLKQRSGASLQTAPMYSESLDAITALIARALPGWDVHMSLYSAASDDDAFVNCRLEPNYEMDDAIDQIGVNAPTPALALCLALVRAIAAQEKQEE